MSTEASKPYYVDDGLAPIFNEARSFLSYLFKMNPMDSEEPILRILDPSGISKVQEMTIPRQESYEVSKALQEAFSIFDNRLRHDHPACFAYMPAYPSPLAWIGDLLTSVFNVNAAMWNNSSGPSVVENTLLRWLADQAGLPQSAGGCFVSGGSMANMTALVMARDNVLPQRRRSDGVAYISDQTHISVAKGLHMAGFCDYQIRTIPTDQDFRFNVELLSQAILEDQSNGFLPFLIVGSCGTTNTGSIDPLHDLADLAEKHSMWLHVDGAYGASISLSETNKYLADGLGRADTVSWDAHKWLFQTIGSGIVLAKHGWKLEKSFSIEADYIKTTRAPDGSTSFYNVSPELSRPSRAMSLWFTLKVLGHQRVGKMIDQGVTLASVAEQELIDLGDWEIIAPPTLSVVVFRYNPFALSIDDKELDSINLAISKRLIIENIAAIFTTKLRGRTVLRMCMINPLVQQENIVHILRRMNQIAQKELGLRPGLKESPITPVSFCSDSLAHVQPMVQQK